MARRSKEEWKTYQNVFDQFTHRNIFKLASQGYFEELKSTISMGKEANIFSAETKDGQNVILKIYRLETCDFNKMYDYIKYDPRYAALKKQRRQVIFSWAQREFRNLIKAREVGIRVPTPIKFNNNILILEFIGKNDHASPKLKDQDPKDPEKFFKKTVDYMKKLHKLGMVHGDLSQYNILNHNDQPILIDFSAGTMKRDPNYMEYLERDIKNICSYFRKIGVSADKKEVLGQIIGKN